jgi:hypothetical protein
MFRACDRAAPRTRAGQAAEEGARPPTCTAVPFLASTAAKRGNRRCGGPVILSRQQFGEPAQPCPSGVRVIRREQQQNAIEPISASSAMRRAARAVPSWLDYPGVLRRVVDASRMRSRTRPYRGRFWTGPSWTPCSAPSPTCTVLSMSTSASAAGTRPRGCTPAWPGDRPGLNQSCRYPGETSPTAQVVAAGHNVQHPVGQHAAQQLAHLQGHERGERRRLQDNVLPASRAGPSLKAAGRG